jgi:hypothetical protein
LFLSLCPIAYIFQKSADIPFLKKHAVQARRKRNTHQSGSNIQDVKVKQQIVNLS